MIDNKLVPAHILVSYIWEILDANTRMEKINGSVPIVAINDEPAFSESKKPYVIYGYAESSSLKNNVIHGGVFTGRVIAPNFSYLTEILGAVARAFEDSDVVTENINIWSSNHQVMINNVLTDVDFEGVRFTSVSISYVEASEPAEAEGDPIEGTFSIAYEYISRQPVVFPTNGGLWL